jgi:hypothetical protein
MDRDKLLKEIFENDPLGLLAIKPTNSSVRNEDERLVASFQEINLFFEQNNREPELGGGIQEHLLYSRLKSIRENPLKVEMLKVQDIYGLLDYTPKEITSLDDVINDDVLGILGDDNTGLFDLKHVTKFKERESTDFVAQRKPCRDFNNYESKFKQVQAELKSGKRKLIEFKLDNLREHCYYVHNGILLFVEKINITRQEHYKPDGTRVREDGRTRCIFENGTESNMLKRSIEKILYINGKVVSENSDNTNNEFLEKFSNINDEDREAGFIYILKSKSDKLEIKEINNLFKIGFSKGSVEERVRNASQEPTYLMADVKIVMAFKCYNMNPHKLEQLVHGFFGNSCLNVDVTDLNGNRHTPREWFIAPLHVIEQAIHYIIAGAIVKYRYDDVTEEIVERFS